jgi:NTE family protein
VSDAGTAANAAGPSFAAEPNAAETTFPCGPSGAPEEVGLALSGGGYRATLFHLGALWRLNELGWLGRIDRISTVSGGSLMAGVLARAWDSLRWDERGRAANFADAVVKPTLSFTGRRIDAFVIALGLIPFVNPANLMAHLLNVILTRRMRLGQLPDRPRFVFNAAHLGTGVSWRFSKPYMGDSKLGIICHPDVPVAKAVAASAAFPPFVAPLVLNISHTNLQQVRGADVLRNPRHRALRQRVLLLDGGAYDNLGIETVEGRCRVVLASDAGGNLKIDARGIRYRFWWPLVRRSLDMAVEVGRAQRRRALIDRAEAARSLREATGRSDRRYATQTVALWRTSFELAEHPMLPTGWTVAPGWHEHISTLSTRMWPMERIDRDRTVNWGYLMADIMLRKWVPDLADAPAPTRLPFPEANFTAPPPRR